MSVATVTTKGQITIPAEVRTRLGLQPGSRVNFVQTDNGSYELTRATGSITALKGLLVRPARPVTLEQMDTAIAEAAVERLAR